MPLSSGARLGPYEIQAAIGAGGMGEVYKARDTRLDRTVAIKVLPPEFSGDSDRRARFHREAKTIAGLTHPHICTLHDIGTQDGMTYLVMEHLTGETLAERLQKSRLPLDQALTVATEIADALAAAHRQGIIHRDLKPGNVMLTKTGTKLLDFGLAKLKGHGAEPAAAQLASMPTRSAPLTAEGAIVGTLQYMAPEQVEGKPADARTDLWALGAILYEMLTGKRAFEGTSAASLIGNIMNAEPAALATLQPLTPPALDRVVRQCLAKAPEDRPDTAHDVSNDLRWLRETSAVGAGVGVPTRRSRWRTLAPVAIIGVVTLLGGAGLTWLITSSRAPAAAVVRAWLDVLPAEELHAGSFFTAAWMPTPGGSRTALAWTPDGQSLVFVGRRAGVRQIYVRRLDRSEASPVPGTEGVRGFGLSADGRWVAFACEGKLKKVPLEGGPAAELAAGVSETMKGLTWDPAGDLYFGGGNGRIWRAKAAGGLEEVSHAEEAAYQRHMLPWLLPGGRVLLYTLRRQNIGWGQEEVVALTLATGQRKTVLRDAADARFVPPGHLVFLRRGTLLAVAFDLEHIETRGTPVPVLGGVAQALLSSHGANESGSGQFAVASTGSLAWVPGPPPARPDNVLVAVDRRGRVSPLAAPPRSYALRVRLSPDARKLGVAIQDITGERPWVYDLDRGTLIPISGEGEVSWPLWSRDGQRVAYDWLKDGRWSLAWQPADGTEPPAVLAAGSLSLSSWSPDGRQIAGVIGSDIAVATLDQGQARVQVLGKTPEAELWPEFSPDGRWLAYGSNVSGKFEIYIRLYPGPGPPVLLSINGGTNPAWRQDGRELFYIEECLGTECPVSTTAPPPRMVSVAVEAGSPARMGPPRPLFVIEPGLGFRCMPARCYDVSPDGDRFWVRKWLASASAPPVTHINLILNWFEELKAKVPTTK